MAKRANNDIQNAVKFGKQAYSAVSGAVDQVAKLGKRMKSNAGIKSASDKDDPKDQGLGIMLGQVFTNSNQTDLNAIKKVNPKETVFGKLDDISKYYEELKKEKPKSEELLKKEEDFRTKLTQFLENDAKTVATNIQKIMECVTKGVEAADAAPPQDEESEAEKLVVEVTGSGGDALSETFKAIQENPNVAEDSKKSLEGVTDTVKAAEDAVQEMGKAAENVDNVDKYKAAMEKVGEANDATKTATDKASKEDLIEQKGKFEGLGEVMLGVAAMALVLVAVGLLADQINFGALIAFAVDLAIFLVLVGAAVQLAWSDMDVNMEGVKAALILVAGSALIMMLGGAVMDYIDMGNLTLFTVTLSGFLLAIGWALWEACLDITAKQSMYALVVVAGAALIMFLGAAIVPLIDIGALAQFTLLLGGFLLEIGLVLRWVGKGFNKMTKQSVWALVVVAGAALIMFLGAAIIDLIEPGKLVLFTVTLSGFLLAMSLALWIVGRAINKIKKNALYALALVAGAALIMFLGAAVIDLIDLGNLALFTITLTAFLGAIVLVFRLGGKQFQKAMRGGKDAAILVGVAGLILLIGGLTMKFIEPADITIFTVLLDILLLGVALSFRIVQNVTEMEEKAMGMLAVITLGGLIMLAGGLVVSKFPDLPINVVIFVGLLGVMLLGVAVIMTILGAMQAAIENGAIVSAIIAGITLLGATAFLLLSTAVKVGGGPVGLLINSAAFIGAFAVLGLGMSLLGLMLPVIVAGAAAVVAITAAIIVGTVGIGVLVGAMKLLASAPKIDPKLVMGNVTLILSVASALTPLVLFSGPLVAVAATIFLLAKAISAIAEAVGDIAELKIPIAWDPKTGRATKYRELKQADFKAAGKNTALVVSTLTTGIMKVYDAHPDWYAGSSLFTNSPLEKVIKQSKKLEELMSAIAEGVSAWAKLQVPDQWDSKSGRPTHFKDIKPEEPKIAAKNVVAVITTISNGIMKLWEEHPDWYEDSLFTNSPLVKVIKQNMKIQDLMSAIAEGVKAWASLQVADKWDPKTGKPIHFKDIDKEDPKNAAKNVVDVITCISNGIMKLWEDHPDWYEETEGGFLGMGKKSPFVKVITQNMKLEKLMSAIAEGVKAWAGMQVPDKWDPKTGKPIHFKDIKKDDPINAAANVVAVVTILSEALMGLYEEHPDWYDEVGGNWLKSGKSPFQKVIAQTIKLQDLMSGIAQGVKAWALLQVPDKWDEKTGKPIHFRDLKPTEPVMAGTNTALVVSTLFEALTELYKGHEDWFEDEGGFLGMGGSSKLAKVIKQTLKLSELMSGIAQGVKMWALMQIPDQWDQKTGKPIHYRDLKKDEPKQAAEHVRDIITTLGDAIMKSYEDHKDWYEDKSIFGKIGLDVGATPFSKAVNVNLKLSGLVTNIGEGLQKMANLQMPIKWDKAGKPINFKKMTDKEMEQAGINVGKIITEMGNAIMTSYEEHKDWWEDKSIFGQIGLDMGATPFSKAVNANLKLSELLTNIGKGLQLFANLNMPTKWNEEGQPIDFIEMDDDHMLKAGINVGLVITTLGAAIMSQYDAHKEWYENKSLFGKIFGGIGDTPFVKAISVNLKLAELITNVSKGIKDLAQLKIPTKWNDEGIAIAYDEEMDSQHFEDAGKNIGLIITKIGESLMKTYDEHEDWFKIEVDKDGKVIEGNEKFARTLNANATMGQLIANLAEGIKGYAEYRFLVDEKSKGMNLTAEERKELPKQYFKDAGDHIQEICVVVGQALLNAYDSKSDWFEEIVDVVEHNGVLGIGGSTEYIHTGRTRFGNMITAFGGMGALIGNISEAVKMYATSKVPGPDGKEIPMNKDVFVDAAAAIKEVVLVVGTALMDAYEHNPKLFWSTGGEGVIGGKSKGDDTLFGKIVTSMTKVSGLIASLAEGLASYASHKVAIAWDADGKPIEFQPLTSADMITAGDQVGHIVSTLGLAIGDAYNNSPEAFEVDENGNSPAGIVIKSLRQLMPFIGRVGGIVGRYALEKVLLWNGGHDADGYRTYDEQSLTSQDITNATEHIQQIILAMAQAISNAYHVDEDLFEVGEDSPAQLIAKALDVMGPAVGRAAAYIGRFNEIYLSFNLDSVDIEEVKGDLSTILCGISALYVLFGSDSFGDYKRWGIATYWKGGNDTFREIVEDNGKYIRSSVHDIEKALDTALEIFAALTYYTQEYFSPEQFRIYFNAMRILPTIINGLVTVSASISEMIQIFKDLYEGETDHWSAKLNNFLFNSGSNDKLGLKGFAKISKDITSDLNTTISVFTGFTDKVMFKIIPRMNELASMTEGGHMFEPLMEVIFSFRYAIQALGSNFKDLDTPSFVIKNLFKKITNVDDIDGDDFLSRITALSLSLMRLTDASIKATMAKGEGFKILQTGIVNINNAIAQTKNVKEFKEQTKQLDKYIKAINKVKLNNLKELHKFVNSVNKLAAKMGNLDKLTDALGNKLASQLKKLTEQLQEAKRTIEKADKLQEKRHKSIQDSIKKIDQLMKEHMVVDIKVDSELKSNK